MPDDDPIEDLQKAGMTAGAASARAVEAVLRSREQQVQQPRQADLRQNSDRQPVFLADWEAKIQQSSAVTSYEMPAADADRTASTGQLGTEDPAVDAQTDRGYDSSEARAGRYDVLEVAGVPLEARQAATTADKMNGTDPASAARSGTGQKTQRVRTPRTSERQRGR